ncbi:hypothetical protein CBL_14355 [Carabus blaptoides fortunei]
MNFWGTTSVYRKVQQPRVEITIESENRACTLALCTTEVRMRNGTRAHASVSKTYGRSCFIGIDIWICTADQGGYDANTCGHRSSRDHVTNETIGSGVPCNSSRLALSGCSVLLSYSPRVQKHVPIYRNAMNLIIWLIKRTNSTTRYRNATEKFMRTTILESMTVSDVIRLGDTPLWIRSAFSAVENPFRHQHALNQSPDVRCLSAGPFVSFRNDIELSTTYATNELFSSRHHCVTEPQLCVSTMATARVK